MWCKVISTVVIFAFSQYLGLFRNVVIWQAFLTFFTQCSLVEGQDVESSGHLFSTSGFLCFSSIVMFSQFTSFFLHLVILVKGLRTTGGRGQLGFFPWVWLFSLGSLYSLPAFNTQGSLIKGPIELSYYLDFCSFFFISLRLAQVYLTSAPRKSLKFIISISLLFFISTSLAQGLIRPLRAERIILCRFLRAFLYTSLAQKHLKVLHYHSLTSLRS